MTHNYIFPKLPLEIAIAIEFSYHYDDRRLDSRYLPLAPLSILVDNKRTSVFCAIAMFGSIPLSLVLINLGGLLALIGFFAYAIQDATFNLIGFFYGVPLLLGGLALKSAELEPVPFESVTPANLIKLRAAQATPTLNQIRKDVTRYRYGQEAHLDVALEKLGLAPSDDDRPILTSLQESEIGGAYALTLKFYSPFMSLDVWQEKQAKITRFFGPGINVQIEPGDDREEIKLTLIVDRAQAPVTSPV
jgi:hypothetical protein